MIRPMHRLHFAAIIALSLLSVLSSISLISAFSPPSTHHQLRCNTNINQKNNCIRQIASSKLFYQAGGTVDTVLQRPPAPTRTMNDISLDTKEAIHINDSNYKSILQSNKVTLIDCYIPNCGPCRLIDKTLSCILPKYTNTNQLSFYKWDVNERTNSQDFMNLLRQYDMTFSKLPTLLLFVNGVPTAMRSGMASVSQIDMFLEEHLPRDNEEEGCVNEIDLQGEMTFCNE